MSGPCDTTTCPKCGAKPGARCKALTSGRTTDTHEARWDKHWSGIWGALTTPTTETRESAGESES